MKLAAVLLSLLAASSPGATMAAPPDRCCCIPLGGGGCDFQFRCDGTCANPSDGSPGCDPNSEDCTCSSESCDDTTCTCNTGGPAPAPGPGPSGSCTPSGTLTGPEIAMAWVSDQYANFDRVYNFGQSCDDGNQFKCCHDWLLDSFAGINVVSLAFLKPTEILSPTGSGCGSTDPDSPCDDDGVRKGMPGAIKYFYDDTNAYGNAMDLVFVSIGGATYKDDWEAVLLDDPEAFAIKVAAIATDLDVGVEIDYEESANPLLDQLQVFVEKYRSIHPFVEGVPDPPHPSFLTIDFGQGAQFMGPVANWVAQKGFNPNPTLIEPRYFNWANAMVGGSRQSRPSDIIDHWYQHVHGYSTLQTKPIAPANLVVSLWSSGRSAIDNCISDDPADVTLADPDVVDFITNVEPCIEFCGECKAALPALPAGQYTKGVKGYAYWMVGNISPRRSNTCTSGDGVTTYEYTVYDNTFEGDGDCEPGFVAAANEYPSITGYDVDWEAREY